MGGTGALWAGERRGDDRRDVEWIGGAGVDAKDCSGYSGDARDLAGNVELQLSSESGVCAGVLGGSVVGCFVLVGGDFAVPNFGEGSRDIRNYSRSRDGGGNWFGTFDAGPAWVCDIDFWAGDLVFARGERDVGIGSEGGAGEGLEERGRGKPLPYRRERDYGCGGGLACGLIS